MKKWEVLENINNIENWQWEMFENIENMRNFGPSSSMGGTLMVPKISDRPTNVGALAKPRPIPLQDSSNITSSRAQ